jgi:hypothetical protein
MVVTPSKLKKAPLRGILKSPMRDMTAPINPSNFYSSNDAEDETKDYSEVKTMNITYVNNTIMYL